MNNNAGKYDVAVIGAGHAGCEAALACARLGLKTLMFSATFFVFHTVRSGKNRKDLHSLNK